MTRLTRPKSSPSGLPQTTLAVSPTFPPSSCVSNHAFLPVIIIRKIQQVLSDLNVSKSPSPDGIQPIVLKCVPELSPFLGRFLFLINRNTFPTPRRNNHLFLFQIVETLPIPTTTDHPSPELVIVIIGQLRLPVPQTQDLLSDPQ